MFRHNTHLIINSAEQFNDNIFCTHRILLLLIGLQLLAGV